MKVSLWVITSGEDKDRLSRLIQSCEPHTVNVLNYKDSEGMKRFTMDSKCEDTLFTANFNRILWEELKGDSDAVLVMNDDIEWEPGSLDRLIEDASNDTADWGTYNPSQVDMENPNRITMGGVGACFPTGKHLCYDKGAIPNLPDVTNWLWIPFCAPLINMKALRYVGLLDPSMRMWFSDSDWCVRSNLMGFAINLCSKAYVKHKCHGTIDTDNNQKLFHSDASVFYYKWNGNVLEKCRQEPGVNQSE